MLHLIDLDGPLIPPPPALVVRINDPRGDCGIDAST
jgi:hypothetical protein